MVLRTIHGDSTPKGDARQMLMHSLGDSTRGKLPVHPPQVIDVVRASIPWHLNHGKRRQGRTSSFVRATHTQCGLRNPSEKVSLWGPSPGAKSSSHRMERSQKKTGRCDEFIIASDGTAEKLVGLSNCLISS